VNVISSRVRPRATVVPVLSVATITLVRFIVNAEVRNFLILGTMVAESPPLD
jgi:hypothetical protein